MALPSLRFAEGWKVGFKSPKGSGVHCQQWNQASGGPSNRTGHFSFCCQKDQLWYSSGLTQIQAAVNSLRDLYTNLNKIQKGSETQSYMGSVFLRLSPSSSKFPSKDGCTVYMLNFLKCDGMINGNFIFWKSKLQPRNFRDFQSTCSH